MTMDGIIAAIRADEMNHKFEEEGQSPLFVAPETARILIVGQAPGAKAMQKGLYWDDASGDRLRAFMGMDRDTFYNSGKIAVVPMDFYFPGRGKSGDLPPRKGFAQKWHEPILKLCPDIRLTILIGQYAQSYYLGDRTQKNVTETVRHFRDYAPECFPIVHPSPRNRLWMAKNPWFETEVLPELKKAVTDALSDQ